MNPLKNVNFIFTLKRAMKNLKIIKIIFIFIIFNMESMVFSAQFTNFQSLPQGLRDGSIALGDIDNDGDLDLIATGRTSSNYQSKVYTNNGNGYFNEFENISPGVYFSSIALGDIDNDGDLDLILTGNDGSTYHSKVYKNNGNGNFILDDNIIPGVEWSSVALGDIDNDGDQDLILTGKDAGTSYSKVYKNDGNGNFSFNTNIIPAVGTSSIALGDIDRDNDLDLILTGHESGVNEAARVYKNDKDGNFIFNSDLSATVYAGSIALGDIDDDKDLDLILIGRHYDGSDKKYSKIYTNSGDGNFNEKINITPAVDFGSIALGDIDNDGDLDLILTGVSDCCAIICKIYTNNGAGGFSEFEDITTPGVQFSSIALGDIDNDGDLDLIFTGYDGGTRHLKVFKNTEATVNNPPSVPDGISISNVNGYWRFKWSPSFDDHTSQNMLNYKIAIGTNLSGVYDYSSAAIDYPRGQANIGNVCIITNPYYQSSIPVNKNVYWKVCAIDSAFKCSSYCTEQIVNSILNIDYSDNNLKILPNHIRPGETKEAKIFFGGKENTTGFYHVRILTVGGRRLIKDFHNISYEELNKGITWYLKDDNNNEISSGMYIVFVIGNDEKYIKKFYYIK